MKSMNLEVVKKYLKTLVLAAAMTIVFPQLILAQDFSQSTQKQLDAIEAKTATGSPAATSSASAKTNPNISFVEGSVVSINGSIFVINTFSGSRLIYTAESTKYFNFDTAGKKLIGFEDIKLGDVIMVIGLAPQAGSGTARIIVRDQVQQFPSFSAFGKVNSATPTSIVLENYSNPNAPLLTLTINATTALKSGTDQTLSPSDLIAKDKLVVAGSIDPKGTLLTKTVLKLVSQ